MSTKSLKERMNDAITNPMNEVSPFERDLDKVPAIPLRECGVGFYEMDITNVYYRGNYFFIEGITTDVLATGDAANKGLCSIAQKYIDGWETFIAPIILEAVGAQISAREFMAAVANGVDLNKVHIYQDLGEYNNEPIVNWHCNPYKYKKTLDAAKKKSK